MSDSTKNSAKHIKLFLPGPTEVSAEILQAQTTWMIGHRMPESLELVGRIKPKLKQVFRTDSRVLISASSGTGLWEGASRNCIRERVLHCTNGSFGDRWVDVSRLNGKIVDVLDVDWGQPILPEQVVERLAQAPYDAVAFVHNETSVGITNPVREIARAIRQMPGGEEITIMVDSVSGLGGAELETDAWELDVVITSSQKTFALPPGLAFASVSDRAFEKAKTIPNRGYYFDFITLDESLAKNQTPATPAISLLFALDLQLDRMLAETMEKRWERHLAMRRVTHEWVHSRGFAIFPEIAFASPTVSTISNTHGIAISELNKFLRARGMILSSGYGKIKAQTFRIGTMGDWTPADIAELLSNVDDFLRQQGLL